MKDIPSHVVHQQDVLTDQERANLITADINNQEHLSAQAYEVLLRDIEHRQERAALSHHLKSVEKAVPEVAEGVTWTLLEMDEAGAVEQMEHVAKGAESFLDKLGPIGFFIANGIGLLTTPWRCYREKRWPTRDEWIKMGLCAATIALVAVAVAFPAVGAWCFIAAATAGLIKSIQNIRIKKNELHRVEKLAQVGLDEIQRINSEINELKKMQAPSDEQQHALSEKMKELTAATDRYVRHGHNIHRLKEELHHPGKSLLPLMNVAMSAVALIGVVVSVFFPPAGVGLLIGAGLVSLTTLGVFAVSKWVANRHKKSPNASMIPHPAGPIADKGDHPVAKTDPLVHTQDSRLNHIEEPAPAPGSNPTQSTQISSTALALSELHLHPNAEHAAIHSEVASQSHPDEIPLQHPPKKEVAEPPIHMRSDNEDAVHPLPSPQAAVETSEVFKPLPASDPSLIRHEEEDSKLKSELQSIIHPAVVENKESKDGENDEEEEKMG